MGCNQSSSTDPVDLSVTNVSDLYAYQFDLAFDPSVLSASPVTLQNAGLFDSGLSSIQAFAIDGTVTVNSVP